MIDVGDVTVGFLAFDIAPVIIKIVVSENKNSNQRKGKSNMDYIIETENLTKRYGTATVVDKGQSSCANGQNLWFARQKRSRQNHSNEK